MTPVPHYIRGHFDVQLSPLPLEFSGEGVTLGRLAIDKVYHGDLDATSRGQMLSARTGVEGSAGYVALEAVSGVLVGRRGTFVLQHSGTLRRGEQELALTVVPDSGTGDLVGLVGEMAIFIEDGQHTYTFAYWFAE